MSARTGWFHVTGHIVGNLENWSTCYHWDGQVVATRQAAIDAGIKENGHDDFNVGCLENDRLTWWGWMDTEHPAEDRPEVAAGLGVIR